MDWLFDWLILWLKKLLCDRLEWSIGMIDWNDCLIDWSCGWLNECWLINYWWIDWLNAWMIDRSVYLIVCSIDWLSGVKSIDLVDWLESLFDWLKLWLLNECWFDKFSMDWLNKCLNDLFIGRGIDGLIDLIIDLYLCWLIVCLVE